MTAPSGPPQVRWAALRTLVEAALELPESARDEYLDRACGTDVALRRDAKAYVIACEQAAHSTSFMAEPAIIFAAGVFADSGPSTSGAAGEGAVPSHNKPLSSRIGIEALLGQALSSAYTIERELGRGGTATVYLAHDVRHDRSVALKVLDPTLGAALSAERFLREIRVTAGLMHPHILPLHDSGEAQGLLYYVMPFVDGETVRARLTLTPRLSSDIVLRLVRDVASALAYAHRRGVVHRDIKPANILLADDHAVVADFGIARALDRARDLSRDHSARDEEPLSVIARDEALTIDGTSPGTPAYMAPEQTRPGATVDHRADLYALGIVAYEALAGHHPFGTRSVQSMIAAHRSETPLDLLTHCPDVSPVLATIVMQLLAKDPDDRPQSGDDVLRTLIESPPVRSAAPRYFRGRGRVFASVLALLATVGGASYLVARSHAATARGPVAGAQPAVAEAPNEPPITVAVLPFANVGGTPVDEYLGDGLTDELAHALSQLPNVRVAGRSSSYALKGKAVSAQSVGRVLDVAAFLSGTTRRSGGQMRVTTQLVSTTDGAVLWDTVYETGSANTFALQDELTRAVTAALMRSLGAHDTRASATTVARGTADQEAYDLYLKGRYHWLQRGPDHVPRAIELFRAAILRDPRFARAHAGLALAYSVLPNFVPDPTDSMTALVFASANRALALDSTLADAQIALGAVLDRRLEFRSALARFRAAVADDPSSATAHHELGMSLLNLGRTTEALAELRHASDLDPMAIASASAVALALVYARRFPEARSAARRALAIDSNFVYALWPLGLAQLLGAQADSAVRTFERARQLYPNDSRMTVGLLLAESARGNWPAAERARAQLRGPDGDRSGWADAAVADLAFGNREPLLKVLENPAGQRRYVAAGAILGCNPILDPVRSDPRFQAAMRRLSVEECATTAAVVR